VKVAPVPTNATDDFTSITHYLQFQWRFVAVALSFECINNRSIELDGSFHRSGSPRGQQKKKMIFFFLGRFVHRRRWPSLPTCFVHRIERLQLI
jgi:hypothetical protein